MCGKCKSSSSDFDCCSSSSSCLSSSSSCSSSSSFHCGCDSSSSSSSSSSCCEQKQDNCFRGPRGKRGKQGKSAPDQGFSAEWVGTDVAWNDDDTHADTVELVSWSFDGIGLYKKEFQLKDNVLFKVPCEGKYQLNAAVALTLAAGQEGIIAPTSLQDGPHLKFHVHRKDEISTLARIPFTFVATGAVSNGILAASLSGVFKLKKGDRLALAVDVHADALNGGTITAESGDRNVTFSAQRLA